MLLPGAGRGPRCPSPRMLGGGEEEKKTGCDGRLCSFKAAEAELECSHPHAVPEKQQLSVK